MAGGGGTGGLKIAVSEQGWKDRQWQTRLSWWTLKGVWSMCTGNIFAGGNMSPSVKVETGAESWKVGSS